MSKPGNFNTVFLTFDLVHSTVLYTDKVLDKSSNQSNRKTTVYIPVLYSITKLQDYSILFSEGLGTHQFMDAKL